MELNQDVFFKEYYNLQEAIKSNIHRRIWREIEGSKKQLYDALADQEQQKDVIEIMQLVSSQKDIQNKINGIWVEFYKDLDYLKIWTYEVWWKPNYQPEQKKVNKVRIVNDSLFYKWVEDISSNDEHKLRFLEDTIINATRNVIYDFDIANYDDRFLDFWNLTHKVSNYLKTLSPLPINFLRKLSYTNEVIALQKKSSLVQFITWYVQWFLHFGRWSLNDSIRDRSLYVDSKEFYELVYRFDNANSVTDLNSIYIEIVNIVKSIRNDLWEDYGNKALYSITQFFKEKIVFENDFKEFKWAEYMFKQLNSFNFS